VHPLYSVFGAGETTFQREDGGGLRGRRTLAEIHGDSFALGRPADGGWWLKPQPKRPGEVYNFSADTMLQFDDRSRELEFWQALV